MKNHFPQLNERNKNIKPKKNRTEYAPMFFEKLRRAQNEIKIPKKA
jgi:hypothetical protein